MIAHKKRRYREKQKEQERNNRKLAQGKHNSKMLKKYAMGDGHGHKKTNLKKIYGMGDQALALKLLNNMNSRK